ncbi:hypothetical protein [Marinomonas sp. TW1]|uniref:hypothetical protein n=1 Tax=Marinomonas sp. TW1 TaxID=1561203 RepID=UPI0007AF5E3E|nr:hypothetical protein [Marinomonas sp. TW1]KZN12191.1 hypothetical protein OA79_17560 [Marinomonas sp. TW1]
MSFLVLPEKAQTTKATIGLGNVTVGNSNLDEQAQFANLNRDVANSQEITKDIALRNTLRNKSPTSQSQLYRGI